MKAVRCSNGHWYDFEIYNRCPKCGQQGAIGDTIINYRPVDIDTDDSKTDILHKKEKSSSLAYGGEVKSSVEDNNDDKTVSIFEV